jgi:hypothetical protein
MKKFEDFYRILFCRKSSHKIKSFDVAGKRIVGKFLRVDFTNVPCCSVHFGEQTMLFDHVYNVYIEM